MTVINLDEAFKTRPEPERNRQGQYLIRPADGGEKKAYTRATTWAKTLDDQEGLIGWSMRMTALGLVARKDLFAQVAACRPDDKKALDQLTEKAKEAGGGSTANGTGTALHGFTERVDLGETFDIPDLWRPDVDAYRQALTDAGLTVERHLIERVVVCEALGVAGTFDRVYRQADGRLIVGDLKTGQSLAWSRLSIAVQLAIYANADTIYDCETCTHQPMPPVRRDAALVVSVPAGSGKAEVLEVDIETGWRYATTLARDVRQARNHGKRKTGDCLFQPYVPLAELVVPGQQRLDQFRGWVLGRIEQIKAKPEAARYLTICWPEGVPGTRNGHPHSVAELEQIAAALDHVEARYEIPFGDTDPRAPKPSDLPAAPNPASRPAPAGGSDAIDEGPDLSLGTVDLLRSRVDRLPDPVKAQLNGWAKEAHRAGVGFSLAHRRSVRRQRIYEAVIALGTLTEGDPDNDDLVRATLAAAGHVQQPKEIGVLLGTLTVGQAAAIPPLVAAIAASTPALAYSQDGIPRWEWLNPSASEEVKR